MSGQPEKPVDEKPTAPTSPVSEQGSNTLVTESNTPTPANVNNAPAPEKAGETPSQSATPAEDGQKVEAKKPPTVEELQAQINDMSAALLRGRRDVAKANTEKKGLETQIAELKRDNGRLEKQVKESQAQGFEKFVKDLLNVADNLERAIGAIPEAKMADLQFNSIVTGVQLTSKQLTAVFNKFGIAKMESPVGKEFDPSQQEAVMMREKEGVESGHVVEVMQSGYMLKDKVLRPARVVVAP